MAAVSKANVEEPKSNLLSPKNKNKGTSSAPAAHGEVLHNTSGGLRVQDRKQEKKPVADPSSS